MLFKGHIILFMIINFIQGMKNVSRENDISCSMQNAWRTFALNVKLDIFHRPKAIHIKGYYCMVVNYNQ